MQEISRNPDPESSHIKADRLLCKALEELGYKDGVEVFRAMSRWYA